MEEVTVDKRPEPEAFGDTISHLPDAIIHHILSSFSLKSIAQLGTLSQRWSYIWNSYPNLDFSELKYNSLEFVQNVLRRCHRDSNVKVFRLTSGEATVHWLNRCLIHLVNHRVEELELKLDLTDICEVKLPCRLLTSGSLKSLKLHFDFLHSKKTKITNPINPCPLKAHALCLRSLTTMSLQNVKFPTSPRFKTNKNDVFSDPKFPKLKFLHLKHCRGFEDLDVYCSGLEDLSLDGLELKSLSLFDTKLAKIMVLSCLKESKYGDNFVNISAPNVGHLGFHCHSVCETLSVYLMKNLSSFVVFGPRVGFECRKMRSVVNLIPVVVASSSYIFMDIFVNKIFADVE